MLTLTGAARAEDPRFAPGIPQGIVVVDQLFEASGLAVSRQNPGVLWTHNDNGAYLLFAFATNGQHLATWELPNLFPFDAEDIALGYGPDPELQYLYLGNIGDNNRFRQDIRIIRIPEPAVYLYATNPPPHRVFSEAVELTLRYPDGPFNAETLLFDPITKDVLVVTKNLVEPAARFYRATQTQLNSGEPVDLQFVTEVGFLGATGGDISSDGREIILRSTTQARLWRRHPGQILEQALAAPPLEVPVIGRPEEPNGEAVAFHTTGLGYYTLSEGLDQPLYFFARTSDDAPAQPIRFIGQGEAWTYYDQEEPPEGDWKAPTYDDSSWKSGSGKFGYGRGDEWSLVDFGPDSSFKIMTHYFRKSFLMDDPTAWTNLTLRFLFNDGIVLYLNGREIFRRNIEFEAGFFDAATADHSGLTDSWVSTPFPSSLLQSGTNYLATELHRFTSYGPWLSFDLQLSGYRNEEQLLWTSVPHREGAGWQLELAGPISALVSVEASTNLIAWSELGTLTLTNGTGVYLDEAAKDAAPRFYRARLLPP